MRKVKDCAATVTPVKKLIIILDKKVLNCQLIAWYHGFMNDNIVHRFDCVSLFKNTSQNKLNLPTILRLFLRDVSKLATKGEMQTKLYDLPLISDICLDDICDICLNENNFLFL